MKTLNYVFDARQHEPDAGFELVPAGMYNVVVDSTEMKFDEANAPQCFLVGFQITDGEMTGRKIFNRYSLWSGDAQVAKISHGQLSALSHVTGVYTIDMNNTGAALHGARLRVRVSNDGKYNNVKEVFDVSGNKPNRAGTGGGVAVPVATATPAPQQFAAAPVNYGAPAAAPTGFAAPAPQQPAFAAPVAAAPAAPFAGGVAVPVATAAPAPAPQQTWAAPAQPAPAAPQQFAAPAATQPGAAPVIPWGQPVA